MYVKRWVLTKGVVLNYRVQSEIVAGSTFQLLSLLKYSDTPSLP